MRLRIAAILAILAILVCQSGCTSVRLRQRTIHQGSTLPDLQYQQVLNNLAQFATNPAALPWHVNLREGTTQVTDSVSGGALVDLGPPAATQPQLFGSRTVVEQWGMSPVIDHAELRLIRIAYRRASGSPEMPTPEFLDELAHELKNQLASNADLRDESELFYEYQWNGNKSSAQLDAHVITTNDDFAMTDAVLPPRELSPLTRNVRRQIAFVLRDLARIQPGWFHVGGKKDVPKNACYVGRCHDCYVWVCPEGREALTEFTLTVLKLSSLIKETQTLISPGSVKFSPGDRGS
jgi:hypothetical protein